MTQATLIFEASKNSLGDYECHSVAQENVTQNTTSSAASSGAAYSEQHEYSEPHQTASEEALNQQTQQSYFIDPNLVNVSPPPWVLQANELFQQGLRSNIQGGYSDYLTQMQQQFELMRATLHEQMKQYSQQD